jgi:hypothetical protein
MEDPTSHSLAIPDVGLYDISAPLELWSVLQEDVEVEDDDVHVVIPRDQVSVAQLSEERAEHDARTNPVLVHDFEEVVNVANDQVPLVEEAH